MNPYILMKKNTSFTLIELLVVIVIIGVLAAVIVVTTTSSISKANIAKLKVFEESVANNLAANMVSRWKLDEKTEISTGHYRTPDAWGANIGIFGDDTTTTTFPTPVAESSCVSGACLSFDGGDYINCGNDDILNFFNHTNKIFTISVWLKRSNFDNSQSIFSRGKSGEGYGFSLRDVIIDDGFCFTTMGVKDYYTTETYQRDGNWHLITLVYDDSYDVSFYKDGFFSEKVTYTVAGKTSNENFIIGNGYRGLIDDLRIYDAALSSSQIKQNYIAGLNSLLSKELISESEYNEKIESLSQK